MCCDSYACGIPIVLWAGLFQELMQPMATLLNGMGLGKKDVAVKGGENLRADGRTEEDRTGRLVCFLCVNEASGLQFRGIQVKSPRFIYAFRKQGERVS